MDWKNCRLIFDEELRAIHDGKALEQEPCDDCIRREDALMALTGEWTESRDEILSKAIKRIKGLPPVTPQPKMGRWIEVTNGRGGHECDLCYEYAPSYQSGDEYLSQYCPKCGAKMQEVEE
jgi:Zn finger protein HypA/HybF involved in hydrogenase expression